MLFQALIVLLSHWRRKPLQLAMLIMGLALATALWSAVQAINGEARASYARASAVLGQDRLPSLAREDGARFSQQIYVDLRRAGWNVSPILEGSRRFGDTRLRIIGIDPLTLPREAGQFEAARSGGNLVEFVTAPGLLYVSADTAVGLKDQPTPPLIVSETLPPGTAVTDIGHAQTLLTASGMLSRLLISPVQPRGQLPLAQVTDELLLQEPAAESGLSRLTASFHLNLTAFGFLSFAIGFFIVYASIGLAFEQRRPMFRTLRATGLPASSLVSMLGLELAALALFSGLVGVGLGYVIAGFLLPDVATSLRGLYGAEISGTLSLRPQVWVAGLSIAVLGTLLSSALGLVRVGRMPILQSARPRAWAIASERMTLMQALAAALLLIAAAMLLGFGSGLAAGFALLGAFLLAAALLLPLLLAQTVKLGARLARGPVAQWFWADTRQQLPGLSLALMALLLALAANIGVGTMVSSFRLTFIGWLDQRLASELYVSGRDPGEAQAMRDWLLPRSDAVLPIWNVEGLVLDQPVLIFGIADHATYRDNWPLIASLQGQWDDVAAGRGLLINEQLARRGKLRLGDMLSLPGGRQLPIAGIYSDYGNPRGQIIIANALLVELYPEVSRLRYGVRVDATKAAALAEELRTAFDLPAENIIDQAEVKTYSLKIFDRTFAVTAALNVLTLGVAALAMLTSLLTLSGMRIAQLAPVWAIGLTRQRLAGLELLRCLTLAAFTITASIPIGLGLAWVLLAVVNVEAFGWRLPFHVFPLDWLILAGLALLASALAALLPAIRLRRVAPAALLKAFAHEA
jgi:putative ABC transport system permease protein